MSLSEEVQSILTENITRPLDAYQGVRKILIEAIKEGGSCDPLGSREKREEGNAAFHLAHDWFIYHDPDPNKNREWFFASEKLLIEWWNILGLRQFSSGQYLYRADTAFLLTKLYETMHDAGMALRWAMHMQADDILGGHEEGGGAGRQTLTTKYGLNTFAFDELSRIAAECLDEVKKKSDWSKPEGFAEEVICRFARGKAGYALAELTSNRQLPVSQGYFSSLLKRMESAKSNNEKGKSLELLVFYLFTLSPGCVPHHDIRADDELSQTDLLVHNLSPHPNVMTDLLGRSFLVECKNWKAKVGVPEIGYFLYRMKFAHTKFGIIFTRNGITGENHGKSGQELIRRAFHEDDCICVVIGNSDLDKLKTGSAQYFWWLLLDKIEAIRFNYSLDNSQSL